MPESHVNVDQLVDIALAKPRTGVLNLVALHSLLHIIVRKLNLGKCKVELPTHSEKIKKYLQSRSPIAIHEYKAGKVVPREHSRGGKFVIKHPKNKT